MKPRTQTILEDLFIRYPGLSPCRRPMEQALERIAACLRGGGKLLVCGNGGSAADAQHIVGELMKSFARSRKPDEELCAKIADSYPETGRYVAMHLAGARPALSFAGESALMTAYSSDAAADLVFAQQVFGHGREGDVLIAISTSGNSSNVLYAAQVARVMGMEVVAMTGRDGGKLRRNCDVLLAAPETETFKVQECHLPLYHALCLALENEFFGE